MFAIVTIAGQQFKVEEGRKIFVHRLDAEVGQQMQFTDVLLAANNGETTLGAPNINGASISATVLDHVQGDKVIVFKKKRRKGYRVKNGHRQPFTQIQIDSIAL
jgi:large subunit ribosomal protein L21